MEKLKYNSKWLLICIVIILSACSSKNLKQKLIKENSFFAKDKSVLYYNSSVLENYNRKNILSLDTLKCISGDQYEIINNLHLKLLKDDNLELRMDLALCYFMAKDYSKSMSIYRQVLSLTNNKQIHSLIYNNLGLIFFEKDYYQQASTFFRKALGQNKSNDISRYNLSLIQFKMGQRDKALKSIEKLSSRFSDPYILTTKNLGVSLYGKYLGSSKEIIDLGEKCIDCELFAAIKKFKNNNSLQKLELLKDTSSGDLSSIGKAILKSLTSQLEAEIEHEKNRNHIYTEQQARIAGNKK